MRFSAGESLLRELALVRVASVADSGNSAVPVADELRELAALAVDADQVVRYALVHPCFALS
jgi:hypothetical protein